MPSTHSTSVLSALPSSTVMTPSLPTRSIASAIILPISRSLWLATLPTCSMAVRPLTGIFDLSSSATMRSTALSMPRLTSIEFAPAATFLRPSLKMASARTVAVVVPSPAVSLVFEATSRTSRAPRFSSLSCRSISFATVTPSLVTVGEPKLFWITTFRPRGPSVIFTAAARISTPFLIFSRASWP